MARWECIVCGLIYDEKEGWPDDGIPAGTKWSDVPDDWLCPDCGVGKDDFELIPGSEGEAVEFEGTVGLHVLYSVHARALSLEFQ